jgi:Uncharacterized protein conserved in bacteria
MVRASAAAARRLMITAQGLAGPRPAADAAAITAVVDRLRRLQLDPTRAVERSHLLVLWSRLGPYDPAVLDSLLWEERRLFEYQAFIAPSADYPLFATAMKRFPLRKTKRAQTERNWLAANRTLSRHIVSELRRHGPMGSSEFEDRAARDWQSSGWSNKRNVSRMLELLSAGGKVMVAGRESGHRLWDLPERHLPTAVDRRPMPLDEALRQSIDRSVRSQGIAPVPVPPPFSAAPWPLAGLPTASVKAALQDLVRDGRLLPAEVVEPGGGVWRGDWFVHAEHVALLEQLENDLPEPRTTLLSPFDPMIADRDRLERLFGFRYRLEIYLPEAKREFGYWVMPILHGERFIGRADLRMDRSGGRLVINALDAEPNARTEAASGRAIRGAFHDLARFLGATSLDLRGPAPAAWRRTLTA